MFLFHTNVITKSLMMFVQSVNDCMQVDAINVFKGDLKIALSSYFLFWRCDSQSFSKDSCVPINKSTRTRHVCEVNIIIYIFSSLSVDL